MRDMNKATMLAAMLGLGLEAVSSRQVTQRRWKAHGTSATGSITVEERESRNQRRKAAKKAKRRNR